MQPGAGIAQVDIGTTKLAALLSILCLLFNYIYFSQHNNN